MLPRGWSRSQMRARRHRDAMTKTFLDWADADHDWADHDWGGNDDDRTGDPVR